MFFSAASMWEMAIKSALGRLDLFITVEDLLSAALAAGFREIPVRSSVALRVASLPMHHGDPFYRLLVAQAMSEPATLLTADTAPAILRTRCRLHAALTMPRRTFGFRAEPKDDGPLLMASRRETSGGLAFQRTNR